MAASAIWIIHRVLWWQKCHRKATPQTNTISQRPLPPLDMSSHTKRLHPLVITADIPRDGFRGHDEILHERSLLSLFCDGTLCWTLILPHLLYSINIINVPSLQTPTNHLAKLQRANQWCEAVEFSHYRHDSRWLVCLLVQQRSQPFAQVIYICIRVRVVDKNPDKQERRRLFFVWDIYLATAGAVVHLE